MKVLMAESTSYRGPTRVGSHAYADAFCAGGDRVFWLGTPLYPHSFLSSRTPELQRRIDVWKRGGVTSPPGIREYYPLTFLPVVDRPLLRTRFAVRNTLRATLPAVADVLMRSGFRDVDLLWLSQSRISAAVTTLVRARRVACRLSDDWEHFDNVPQALVAAERELLRRADVVFATSRRLVEKARVLRDDVVYLPNGVGEAFFDAGDAPPPAALSDLAPPRIVFVGTLGPWVDHDRVAATARRCKGASVVLVGPGTTGHGLPENVHRVGPQPFETIPAILRHSDVAIIPFARNALTESVSPVKLYEYLATGIPVVATRLDEIAAADSPAVLADGVDDFAEAVASLLEDASVWSRERAVAWARGHTWASRFARVREALA